MVQASEIPVNIFASAMQMAQSIFGTGTTVVGASYSGDYRSSGIYSNGDALMPGVAPGDGGVILSTGRAQDITNSRGIANQSNSRSSNTSGENNNADFNAIAGTNTYDASYLDIDFVPSGDVMTIQFSFLSDEYPEYAGSIYNDVVGVWINGSHVPLEVGSGNTSVTNINQTNNENLFIDNTNSDFNTEMDGFTVTMTLTIPVIANAVNSIRIGIADASDSSYDSSLMIAAGSVQTALVAIADDINVAPDGTRTLDVLANDVNNTGGALTITHVNGQAVSAGDIVTLATGQQIQLNANGTFTIVADADEETVSFTYGVLSDTGQSDTGFVTVSVIPCFTSGTLIRTPQGERLIDRLVPGDLVMTRAHGPRPLRWIGRRTVAARGDLAPIRIRAGTLGDHGTLIVSPQHRIYFHDRMAELLFGEGEVLVAAKDLVNGRSIQVLEGGTIEYIHLLFDHHEVIWSEGLATESFLPGPHVLGGVEAEMQREICALFPQLDLSGGTGYPQAAHRLLRAHEARLWCQAAHIAA